MDGERARLLFATATVARQPPSETNNKKPFFLCQRSTSLLIQFNQGLEYNN
jgi:hypothetical protein